MAAENTNVSPDYKNITIFPGLNALRFIAAFLVVIHHGETIRKKNGMKDLEWLGLFRNGGPAVTFFFVLSGFLITYLLLKENGKTGDVNVKHFYLKRVLRIWPLYFLLVFIGTIVLPFVFNLFHVEYVMPYTLGQTWFYFVFFLPGLVTFYFGNHFLQPLWSIGVEEVFYLFWAPVFKIGKNRILVILISVILVKLLAIFLATYIVTDKLFIYLVDTFRFEAMAIGGLGAYFLYTQGRSLVKSVIFKIPCQIAIVSFVVIYLVFDANINNPAWNFLFKGPISSSVIIDFVFLYIIICVSVIENSIIKLRSRALSFLGEISYGIYMYHMLAIFIVIFLAKKHLLQMNAVPGFIVFYTLATGFTILFAFLSKKLFEDYFLNLKKRLDRTN